MFLIHLYFILFHTKTVFDNNSVEHNKHRNNVSNIKSQTSLVYSDISCEQAMIKYQMAVLRTIAQKLTKRNNRIEVEIRFLGALGISKHDYKSIFFADLCHFYLPFKMKTMRKLMIWGKPNLTD